MSSVRSHAAAGENFFMMILQFLETFVGSCYERRRRGAVNYMCIREAQRAIYRIHRRHTPNPRIEEKTILPLTIIL